MRYVLLITAVLLCLTSVCLGGTLKSKPVAKDSPSHRALATSPQNEAAVVGNNVTMTCRAEAPPPNTRILWGDYIWNGDGSVSIISDNNNIMPGHSQAARYTIINNDPAQFDLYISSTVSRDGGMYVCQDLNDGPPTVNFRGYAQLVMLYGDPNCTTTLPADGNVIEGQYHTVECIIGFQGQIAPAMTWTGPDPYNTVQINGINTIWSGASFNVNRSQSIGAFQCTTQFLTLGFVPNATEADNLPQYIHVFQSNQLFVNWPPGNLDYFPAKEFYDVNDTITCTDDAWPLSSKAYQNLRDFTVSIGDTFTVTDAFVGTTTTMRCLAQNTIGDTTYTNNLFHDVTVLAPTTTTQATTTPTPTTPPAIGDCKEPIGLWQATNPDSYICLSMNISSNALIIGLMRNGSNPYWMELVGRTKVDDYNLVGYVGIDALDYGVSGFSGECHNCYGVEQLLMDGLMRSRADSAFCSDPGSTWKTSPYIYRRAGSCSAETYNIYRPTIISRMLGYKGPLYDYKKK